MPPLATFSIVSIVSIVITQFTTEIRPTSYSQCQKNGTANVNPPDLPGESQGTPRHYRS